MDTFNSLPGDEDPVVSQNPAPELNDEEISRATSHIEDLWSELAQAWPAVRKNPAVADRIEKLWNYLKSAESEWLVIPDDIQALMEESSSTWPGTLPETASSVFPAASASPTVTGASDNREIDELLAEILGESYRLDKQGETTGQPPKTDRKTSTVTGSEELDALVASILGEGWEKEDIRPSSQNHRLSGEEESSILASYTDSMDGLSGSAESLYSLPEAASAGAGNITTGYDLENMPESKHIEAVSPTDNDEQSIDELLKDILTPDETPSYSSLLADSSEDGPSRLENEYSTEMSLSENLDADEKLLASVLADDTDSESAQFYTAPGELDMEHYRASLLAEDSISESAQSETEAGQPGEPLYPGMEIGNTTDSTPVQSTETDDSTGLESISEILQDDTLTESEDSYSFMDITATEAGSDESLIEDLITEYQPENQSDEQESLATDEDSGIAAMEFGHRQTAQHTEQDILAGLLDENENQDDLSGITESISATADDTQPSANDEEDIDQLIDQILHEDQPVDTISGVDTIITRINEQGTWQETAAHQQTHDDIKTTDQLTQAGSPSDTRVMSAEDFAAARLNTEAVNTSRFEPEQEKVYQARSERKLAMLSFLMLLLLLSGLGLWQYYYVEGDYRTSEPVPPVVAKPYKAPEPATPHVQARAVEPQSPPAEPATPVVVARPAEPQPLPAEPAPPVISGSPSANEHPRPYTEEDTTEQPVQQARSENQNYDAYIDQRENDITIVVNEPESEPDLIRERYIDTDVYNEQPAETLSNDSSKTVDTVRAAGEPATDDPAEKTGISPDVAENNQQKESSTDLAAETVDAKIPHVAEKKKPVVKRKPSNVVITRKGKKTIIIHTIVKGDTLWAIAKRYVNNPYKYPELARLSKIRNPNRIYPGNKVRIIKYRR